MALAFAIGFVVAWLWAGRKLSEAQAARASQQSAADELRKQIETLRADADAARKRAEEEQRGHIEARTSLAETQKNLAEQRMALEEVRLRMTETFRALASEALTESQKQFLELAKTKFEGLQTEAAGDLKQRQEAIRGLVDPLTSTLASLDQKIALIESSRKQDQGQLIAQVMELSKVGQQLREETGSLVTSLRQPHIKGKWGELLLRRAAELTGMAPHCDFEEQLTAEQGGSRPDMVVKLPGGRHIVVDAKVPLNAFLQALSAKTADEYRDCMNEHVRLVRNHINNLGSRRYFDQFPTSPEFVILFLPAEAFFSAALQSDSELIEYAMDKGVVLASPTTLLALLKAIAYGWRQEEAWKNAENIQKLGKKLHDCVVNFLEHLTHIHLGLERANKAFNDAVGSLESRLMPAARKFKDYGVTSADEIPEVTPVETAPRQLAVSASEEEQ